MINVEVDKGANESNANLIRRFTRRVQESNIVRRARGLRYYERSPSDALKKQRKLKSLERREQFEELAKLGKLPEKKSRRR